MNTVITIGQILSSVGLILGLIRLLKGPTSLTRVMSLDVIAFVGLGILILFCLQNNDSSLLDVLIIWSILPFVGTTAFSIYSEKYLKGKGHQND